MSDVFEASEVKESKSRRAVQHVREFMRKSEDYRRPFLDLAESARELYAVWDYQSKSITHRANLQLPFAYQIVESEFPQIVDAFLKERRLFKLQGFDAQDMMYDQALTDFMAGQQLGQMKFPPKFMSFVKGLLLDGTAIAKVPYRFEEKAVIKRSTVIDPIAQIPVPQKQLAIETIFDGPDFENVALEDFFPDYASPSPGDIASMRGCSFRTRKTLSELKGDSNYHNIDELEKSVSSKGANAWKDPYYKMDSSDDNQKDLKKSIEIWEYWGQFDVTGNGDFEEYLIVIANGDVEIRCDLNPYDYAFKPFVATVNVLRDNEFYGISELFAVRAQIKEATALRNSRLDQVSLAVNRMWIVDRASGINAKALYARPNGLIFTNDINGIRELPPPEVPASSFRELQELSSEIQMTTASQGGGAFADVARAFGRSATGASYVSNMAASRAGMKVKLISELMVKPMVEIMMMTNAQFVSDDQWVRVSDPNSQNPFTILPRDAFHTNYDFEIVTNIDENPQETLAKYQQAAQMFQIAEQTQPGTINWGPLFEVMGQKLLGREVKRFIRSDEERMMLQYQAMATEQAANASIGQNAPQPNSGIPGGPGDQT